MYLIVTQKPNMLVPQLNVLIYLISNAYYSKCF